MRFQFLTYPIFSLLTGLALFACAQQPQTDQTNNMSAIDDLLAEGRAVATFGNGCFWCTEAVFLELEGVLAVESGYAGGHVNNPTYREVCTGTTGHAEVIRIAYDPAAITYAELLEVFFSTHDPTTLNRQGNDVGTQYRSAIFYHNEEQQAQATAAKQAADESGEWNNPIVTEITEINNYSTAEDYHQNYYASHSAQPYCAFVIRPKLDKFRKKFKEKLKAPTN
ncbi:MAG: peptide-methionine (S)-S-oxide reductase MsrA [Bacteroidota bacterium]